MYVYLTRKKMAKIARHIILLLTLVFSSSILAQEVNEETVKETFVVRGSVLEKSTYKPIPKVNILVNGGLVELPALISIDNGGYIKMEVAFKSVFFTAAFALFIFVAFLFIMKSVVDPKLVGVERQANIEFLEW